MHGPLRNADTFSTDLLNLHWERSGIGDGNTIMVAPFFRDGAGADPMLWAAVAEGGIQMPEAYGFVPLADRSPIYGGDPSSWRR